MSRGGPDVKAIFTEALGHPTGPEREAYLAEACGGDDALRRRVRELLAAFDRAGEVLGPAGPAADATEVGASTAADTGESTEASDPAQAPDSEATGVSAHTTGEATIDHEPTRPPGEPTTAASLGGLNGDGLAPGTAVRYFGDYEIRRELGRGGMGVVYEARQVSLNRPVALKVVKAGLLAGDDELRRFQNEAEAVALLDHPGIVPVYEVGRHDGQHYFSMKLVPGGSLLPLLGRYKDDPRAAARLVAEAAEAVAHAHARGILHRDLKPANILVDDEGHPHVTDFGLAKKVEADIEFTQSGAILGTPAYMSPEQATGRRGSITTATDVHGLGALLYALLTARAPFGGDSVMETIDAVRNSPPEPPRKLNEKVPRDLETICLKCLEKDPRRRYATAQALADDLKAWLESRPIAARRVGAAERAWLWCIRRPAVAALSAAVALATVGGTVTVIAVQAKANAELRAANRRVEQRYDLAVEAIRTFHTGVSEDFLLKQDQFKDLRDRLLKSASDYYGKLGALLRSQSDFASRRALLQANFEVANLTGTVGRKEDALAIHREVLAARKSMAREPLADPDLIVDVGRSLTAVAAIQRLVGKSDEALATYRTAITVLDDPPGSPPAAARALVADCHTGLGLLLSDRRDTPKAEAEFRQAMAIARRLVDDSPGVADFLGRLAECHNNLAGMAWQLNKLSETEAEYRQAIALYRRLADEHSTASDFRKRLADCHHSLGMVLLATGTQAEADVEMREAQRLHQSLVHDYPGVTEFRKRLADGHMNRGFVMLTRQRPAEAEAEYRQAIALYQRLVDDHPAVTEFRNSLAGSHENLASTLAQTGKPAEAEAESRRAMALNERLADEDFAVYGPRVMYLKSDMSIDRAWALIRAGKTAEAEAAFREALASYQKLADKHPANTEIRERLAHRHFEFAVQLSRWGKLAEAEVGYREALALMQRLFDEHPEVTEFRKQLARRRSDLGQFLLQRGKLGEAEAECRQALAILRKLAADHHGETFYDVDLADYHRNVGNVLWQAGKPVEAEAEYRRGLAFDQELVNNKPGVSHFHSRLAGSHDALGELLSQAGKPGESEAEFRKGLAVRRKIADNDPANARLRLFLAQSQDKLGEWLLSAKKPAEAEAEFRQALAIQQKLVDDNPTYPQFRTELAKTLMRLGRLHQAAGRWDQASDAFRRAVESMERLPSLAAADLYDLACYQALLSGVLGRPGSGPSAAGGRDAADRAMRRLREAVAAGYRDLDHMRTDLDLDPLRSRLDFQLLMMDLAMPDDAGALAR